MFFSTSGGPEIDIRGRGVAFVNERGGGEKITENVAKINCDRSELFCKKNSVWDIKT